MLKFEHSVINHLQLNTQLVWHTGEVNNTTSTHRISALSCCHKIVMGYVVTAVSSDSRPPNPKCLTAIIVFDI